MPLRRIALATAALALAAAGPAYAMTRAHKPPTVLVAKVGKDDGYDMTLTKKGKQVTTLPRGAYTILVHDYSDIHNIRIKGPQINKWTTVPEVVDKTWKINLRKGVYTVVCDPHPVTMIFRVKVI